MPSKYTIRSFVTDGVYHIYNKGVEGREVFTNERDYKLFLYYLYIYLKPLKLVLETYPGLPFALRERNLNGRLELLCYALMPNHFHLLMRPRETNAVSIFMKQLANAYTQYFNSKYMRRGALFQGRYKSVKIDTDNQLIHISRYIHLNPYVAKLTQNPESYPWSSFPDYLDTDKESLCTRRLIQSFFSSTNKYKEFVMDHKEYALELGKIKQEAIDAIDLDSRG